MAITKFRQETDHPMNLRRFSEFMEDLFDNSLSLSNRIGFSPKFDIAEDDKQYFVHVTLPGIKKEDIHIDQYENTLTISGERKHSKEDHDAKYHLIENRYGKFERSLTLPANADSDTLEAKYEDGVLKLSIKKTEKSVGKQIKVK